MTTPTLRPGLFFLLPPELYERIARGLTAIPSEARMRVIRLIILAGATILGIAPGTAQRYDSAYPFCLQKWERGGSSTIYCSYTSWDQCRATALGLSAMCLANPYWSQALPDSQATYAGRRAAPKRSW